MAKGIFWPTGLTGNTGKSLDSYLGSEDGARAFTDAAGKFYAHTWEAASTAAHSPPEVIQPASLPSSGRWLLRQTPYETGPGSMPSGVTFDAPVSGLVLSNSSGDPGNDVDISPGSCMDRSNTVGGKLTAALTKRLDASWVAGNGNGGLLAGSKAASTAYLVIILIKDDTGDIDVGFLADGTDVASNLPAGYSQYFIRGFVLTDSSANCIPFTMAGRRIAFHDPHLVAVSSGIGTSYTACDVSAVVPVDLLEEITFSLVNNYGGSNWAHFSFDGTHDFQMLGEISDYEPLVAVAAATVYVKCSAGTMDLNIAQVRLI